MIKWVSTQPFLGMNIKIKGNNKIDIEMKDKIQEAINIFGEN